MVLLSPSKFIQNAIIALYSWHAAQEHWGFSQGTTFSILMIVILLVIALTSLDNSSNPGARSSIYVLLDAF